MGIARVGIVGSGIMGSGIAEVAATSGHEVVLRSRKLESAQAMRAALERSLTRQVEKGRREQADAEAALARVTATAELDDLAGCDLVIESVVEDLDGEEGAVRRARHHRAGRDAILATNTSTLPVVEMAMVTEASRPGLRHPLLQPGPGDEPGRRSCARSPPPTRRSTTVQGVRHRLRQGRGRGEGPRRLHRQRAAVPLPQQRGADARERHRVLRRHRHRHEGRLQLPDGSVRAARPRRASTRRVAILDALYDEFRDPNYAAVPALRRMVAAGQPRPQVGRGFYDYAPMTRR